MAPGKILIIRRFMPWGAIRNRGRAVGSIAGPLGKGLKLLNSSSKEVPFRARIPVLSRALSTVTQSTDGTARGALV
jgi:hypothetical protein